MSVPEEIAAANVRTLKEAREAVATGVRELVEFLRTTQNSVFRAGQTYDYLPGNPVVWGLPLRDTEQEYQYGVTENGELVKAVERIGFFSVWFIGAQPGKYKITSPEDLSYYDCLELQRLFETVRRYP